MTEIKKQAEQLKKFLGAYIEWAELDADQKSIEAINYFIALASKLDRDRLVGIIQEWLGCESKEKVNHYICDEYRNVRDLADAIIESVVNK